MTISKNQLSFMRHQAFEDTDRIDLYEWHECVGGPSTPDVFAGLDVLGTARHSHATYLAALRDGLTIYRIDD